MSDRPLPRLQLPAALLRFWRGDLAETADELTAIEGVERLGEHLLAVLPTARRGDLFDVAARLSSVLLRRSRRKSSGDKPAGALIFPGRVLVGPDGPEPQRDSLFDDLLERAPRLAPGGITVTGWVAAWLGGRFETKPAGSFDAPSGRRVPLFELGAERDGPRPWHQVDVFGRRARIPRPEIDGQLVEALEAPELLVRGGFGTGKTRAVHAALDLAGVEPTEARVWIGLGRTLPGLPFLGRALARALVERLAERPAGASGAPPLDPSTLDPSTLDVHDPEATVAKLAPALAAARAHFGAPIRLVADRVEFAEGADRRLLDALRPAIEGGDLRLVRIERPGPRPGLVDASLPTLTVPPLDPAEIDTLSRKLVEGLEIPDELLARLVDAAAGRPLALEETLWRLVHRGLVRRVYGSFFYAGDPNVEVEPSERLVRHAEAEMRRLGEPLPLRLLALAGESISPHHLATACRSFGIELERGWQRPWIDAGWFRALGDGTLEFEVPAIESAVADTVTGDGGRSLRHALGGVLAIAESGPGWTAYRLMAGTPEGLPSLLDQSRDRPSDGPSREELFNALWAEYREHRSRHGDESTELEILWALLPLARRLGCLAQLRRELARGVELARGNEQRYVALVALQAELDQERGDHRAAEQGLREALAASGGFDKGRRAALFVRLGALLHRQGRWTEARTVFGDLLSVADSRGPTALGATCHFYLGNVALHERRLDEAEKHHGAAESFRRERALRKPLGASLCALGAVAWARGDFPTALERHQEAEKVLADAGAEPPDVAFALLGTGRALAALGNPTGATKLLRRALEARQGRDDLVGEAIARLELASNHLTLGQVDRALDETRRSSFHLGLVPETALLGDAERLLGRLLLHQNERDAARQHLETALRIHGELADEHALAEDHSWLLELAMHADDREGVHRHALELERLVDSLVHPVGGERLDFRLYRAFRWLAEHDTPVRDPEAFLRRAFQELMRKTSFLAPSLRQPFLYQVAEHQEILDAASLYQISLPIFTADAARLS